MRRILISLAAAIAASLALSAGASADTITTDFEGFSPGSVDEQFGWHSAEPGDVPALPNGYDQEVFSAGFDGQALRHSNAYNEPTGEFEYQTYSQSNAEDAGEDLTNKVFIGEFEFTSTSPDLQDGLMMKMSPDDGHGGRMSYVRLLDQTDGIHATFFDTDADGTFHGYDAGVYARDQVHTVRFEIEFVDGPDNDIVRLIIDGKDIGDSLGECFTTWENYYRNVELEEPPVTNSIEFRADGGEVASLVGGGYLFDNVVTITGTEGGPAPTNCEFEGQIAPTGTTCDQYRDGTSSVLEQLLYTTKVSQINAVSPGVFFYYSKVSGDADQTVDITEDHGTAPAIPILQKQVVLYNADTCKVVKWPVAGLTVNPDGTATGTLPSTGDFIVGVKYNPSALKGKSAPATSPVTYSFGTELDGSAVDGATIDLAKK
jgi:hypothetical protein